MPRPMPTRYAPSTGFILPADGPAYGTGDELGIARLNAGLVRSEPVMPNAMPGPPRADAGNAKDDSFATLETNALSGSVFADNGNGPDTTPGAVAAVNGSASAVNQQITLPSGALLTLNSDGSFTYIANSTVNSAPAPGSGAANIPQQDHFSYTLTNGDTANVTINITGVDTNDLLVGSVAGATLTGGIGNDLYAIVANNVTIIEQAGQGFDAIYTDRTFTLNAGAEVEWLQLSGVPAGSARNLTGNEFGQYVVGHNGDNRLDGGGGADLLIGRDGNDTYLVDNVNDLVYEVVGEGADTVQTGVSYALMAGQSVETLRTIDTFSVASINLAGNEFVQEMSGNIGNNVINGGGGADHMTGFAGNDTYFVDDAGDTITELPDDSLTNGGFDACYTTVSFSLSALGNIFASVEWLSTIDNSATTAIDLTGNATGQYLVGNAGANVLDGKGGADILFGLGGADTFAFTTALGAGNVDTLNDFASGTDKVALDDAIFTQVGGPGALAAGAFTTGPAATEADDRIVYNAATGQLFYDADGNGAGAAVQFATLTGLPVIAASDFTVI